MRIVFALLHGEKPTVMQIVGTFLIAALAAAAALSIWGFGWRGILAAVICADWFGGVIANSARSTRLYWASLPRITVAAFCVVHLSEIPVVWFLLGENPASYLLWPTVIAKISVFLLGQAEFRSVKAGDDGKQNGSI